MLAAEQPDYAVTIYYGHYPTIDEHLDAVLLERYGSKCECLLVGSSFGYAHHTPIEVHCYYRQEKANWNFEKPALGTRLLTPIEVLRDLGDPDEIIRAPKMPGGYTSAYMQQYINEDFPDGYEKIAAKYPQSQILPGVKYIHPTKDRELSTFELEVLYGGKPGTLPQLVAQYLVRHIQMYLSGAWKDQSFEASFGIDSWNVSPSKGKVKRYDFQRFYPKA